MTFFTVPEAAIGNQNREEKQGVRQLPAPSSRRGIRAFAQRTDVAPSSGPRIDGNNDSTLEPESESCSSVVDLDAARRVRGVVRVKLKE